MQGKQKFRITYKGREFAGKRWLTSEGKIKVQLSDPWSVEERDFASWRSAKKWFASLTDAEKLTLDFRPYLRLCWIIEEELCVIELRKAEFSVTDAGVFMRLPSNPQKTAIPRYSVGIREGRVIRYCEDAVIPHTERTEQLATEFLETVNEVLYSYSHLLSKGGDYVLEELENGATMQKILDDYRVEQAQRALEGK